MRVSRRSLLGYRVLDCQGEEIGRVVDTWPDDGGWEIEMVVVRLQRFGERRMLSLW
jgi:sporulation protein YlmC with PRC-barrel domain